MPRWTPTDAFGVIAQSSAGDRITVATDMAPDGSDCAIAVTLMLHDGRALVLHAGRIDLTDPVSLADQYFWIVRKSTSGGC
jgi:hypothetical protein